MLLRLLEPGRTLPAPGLAFAEFSVHLGNRLEMACEGAGLLGFASSDPQMPRLLDWDTPFF